MSNTNIQMLDNEDLRWLQMIRQIVDGLQAQAEIQAESCDREWMAMQYSLESLSETIESCIVDYKERLEVVDGKNNDIN
jgi:predicted metal-dependent hydrolase